EGDDGEKTTRRYRLGAGSRAWGRIARAACTYPAYKIGPPAKQYRRKRLKALDGAVNKCGELRLGQRPHLGGFDVAVLEDHQSGNPADAELWRGGLVLVDVQFGDLEAASVFLCDLIENRCDVFAWTAPFGPVVYQYRHRGLQDFCLERIVCDVVYVFTHERRSPLIADKVVLLGVCTAGRRGASGRHQVGRMLSKIKRSGKLAAQRTRQRQAGCFC